MSQAPVHFYTSLPHRVQLWTNTRKENTTQSLSEPDSGKAFAGTTRSSQQLFLKKLGDHLRWGPGTV